MKLLQSSLTVKELLAAFPQAKDIHQRHLQLPPDFYWTCSDDARQCLHLCEQYRFIDNVHHEATGSHTLYLTSAGLKFLDYLIHVAGPKIEADLAQLPDTPLRPCKPHDDYTGKVVLSYIYQGDSDWMVEVRVEEFENKQTAKIFMDQKGEKLRYLLDNLYLYEYDSRDWAYLNPQQVRELIDGDIVVSKLKEDRYGKTMLDESDFERVDVKIKDFKRYPGLSCGFESLAYGIIPAKQF